MSDARISPKARERFRTLQPGNFHPPKSRSPELPAPVLLHGEVESDFDEMLRKFREAIRPSDYVEEIWVRDIADLTWEILRWRRLKASLLNGRRFKGVHRTLVSLVPMMAGTLSQGWNRGDPGDRERVEKEFVAAGRSGDEVIAETVVDSLGDVTAIEGLLDRVQTRRDNTLREMDRRREVLARMKGVLEVVDVEFAAVDGSVPSEKAA